METESDTRQFRLGWPHVLCNPWSLEFGAQFLTCFFSLIQRENWISIYFFCSEQFCKSCLCTSSFCQPFSLRRIKYKHIQLQETSEPLRQGILLLLAADVIQDPKVILEAFAFFPKYCSDSQINLTINLLSGYCPLVCMTSTYILGKWSLIFVNKDICQLCMSV